MELDYKEIRTSIINNWPLLDHFKRGNLKELELEQIISFWEELKSSNNKSLWNSFAYLAYLITELSLRIFFINNTKNENYSFKSLGDIAHFARKKYSNHELFNNKKIELYNVIESLRKWRNQIIHNGISILDHQELRATQALVLMVRTVSDTFPIPIPKFSDETGDKETKWWIPKWQELPPQFVLTRIQKLNKEDAVELFLNPDIFFNHLIPFLSPTRIIEYNKIVKKFELDVEILKNSIKNNFAHMVIGSGRNTLENSWRTILELRKLNMDNFANAFSVILPSDTSNMKKALNTLDDIEIKFFFRELFRPEHFVPIEIEDKSRFDQDIVKNFCRRFLIDTKDLTEKENERLKKILESLPVDLRKKAREELSKNREGN